MQVHGACACELPGDRFYETMAVMHTVFHLLSLASKHALTGMFGRIVRCSILWDTMIGSRLGDLKIWFAYGLGLYGRAPSRKP